MKMWSLVRYSTINYEAIFSRELVYTTERRKSFRARNKQLCSRFQPFIKFPVSNSNYNKMSNNIDDNYVENTIIKSLTMILILMNHSPWRPYNKHRLIKFSKRNRYLVIVIYLERYLESAAKESKLTQGKQEFEGIQ